MTTRRSLSPRHKVRNKVVILFHRLGLPFGPLHLLTVPGRRSGLPRTNPVAPVVVDGTTYILQAYPRSDWVRNARAAGHGVLTRGRRARRVGLVELPEEERGRILREFPGQVPRGVDAFVRNGLVESGSPEHFEAAAAHCPVFRVVPRTP
ncbi:nitroreductase family deazaflavin-dependent oxidoreductase [Streptomyces sp. HUCO-GS316]|uniref:nitroreductase/quinone reductase family protein n=1 Tax=Streptomyces sp. HUCO-GS316 TaxID=2692198 RepID=UPI0013695DB0|nr:nitroreductase/quinone reductase family protein [Streptomyces sp. HUCO-GS316]MXM68574.1 nitroreductase family deazaflavin-dependent oxidoreductase [Streptomyces sp. HUCO-GS316]